MWSGHDTELAAHTFILIAEQPSQLFFGSVEIADIGGVVFSVMQLHDLSRHDRLQRLVPVGKGGQGVLLPHGTECYCTNSRRALQLPSDRKHSSDSPI